MDLKCGGPENTEEALDDTKEAKDFDFIFIYEEMMMGDIRSRSY